MRILTTVTAIAIAGAASAIGQTAPPATFSISSEEEFANWTVIDGNPSDTPYVWTYSDGAATINSGTEAADDWIIAPAVELVAGKSYVVTVSVKSSARYDYQAFSLTAGTEATIAGQTSILDVSSLQNTTYTDKEATFTATASGSHHFGVHCTTSRRNGTLSLQSLTVEAAPEYPAAITDLTATAGEAGALEATLTWTWPSKNSNGGDLSNLSGAKIERIDNSSIWSSYTTIATIATGVEPGGQATYTDTGITKAGPYGYRVTPFSTDGNATASTVSLSWIGEDVPSPVTNLTATAAGETVEINFTPPTTGENGGYINLSAITYKIERTAASTTTTIEEAYAGSLPYVDSSITEMAAYTYTVTPVTAGGTEGDAATSGSVIAGPAFTVPYTADLSQEAQARLYTLIDANADGKTWRVVTSYYSTKSIAYSGTSDAANDWAISPKIKLEAGKAYKISFTARIYSSSESNYKNIAVALGQDATADAMGDPIGSVTVASATATTFSFTANVAESGEWHVGLQVHGATNYNDVYVTALSVEEIPVTPLAPTEMTATRAEGGAMEATVAWTNPTLDNTGAELTAITRWELLRDGSTVVAQKESPTPGAQEQIADTEITEAGFHTYTVRAYLGSNSSEASATTEWVGFDTPLAPTDLTATAEAEKVTLTFTAPTGTVNGGALETEGLGYLISRGGTVVAERYTGELPFVDTVEELGSYTYTVAAVTQSGLTSDTATSDKVVAGGAVEPPYAADFSTSDDYELMTVVDANGDGDTWNYSSYDDAVQIYAETSEEGDWLFTPRINISNHYRYTVTINASLWRAWSESNYTTLNISYGETTSAADQKIIGTTVVSSTIAADFSCQFELGEAPSGKFHIGVQSLGSASAQTLFLHSVSLQSTGVSGAEAIESGENALRYVSSSQALACPAGGRLTVFSAAGAEALSTATDGGNVGVGGLASGVYIASFVNASGETTTIKFIK